MAIELSIRLAVPADVPRLLALYRLLDLEAEPELPIAVAQARFRELALRPGHAIFVAESEGQIVGTFALIFVGGLSHGARDSCIVEDVCVAAEMQRTGIGQQMMDFAMARCADDACYKLVLSSHITRGNAHRFYESLGFRRHGHSFLIDRVGTGGGAG
ncbi:MAG: GNAT family N-acetyltransferase [Bacteriovorax sp.]|nr:GNAT family N-acetyltransferase [Rhizobacter sp.]